MRKKQRYIRSERAKACMSESQRKRRERERLNLPSDRALFVKATLQRQPMRFTELRELILEKFELTLSAAGNVITDLKNKKKIIGVGHVLLHWNTLESEEKD